MYQVAVKREELDSVMHALLRWVEVEREKVQGRSDTNSMLTSMTS